MEEEHNRLDEISSSEDEDHAAPSARATSEIKTAAINKCTPSTRKARAIHKVTRGGLKNLRRTRPIIEQTQEEIRRENEAKILARIVEFEKELGHEPGLLDLLCHFSRQEIHAVWNDLIFLFQDLMSKGTTVPMMVA